MPVTHLAVVMPAYNEADGLPGFLAEIREHLAPRVERLSLVVVDDRSTDDTAAVLAGLRMPGLIVETAPTNRGHGPTALAAYRAGLALQPDAVLHIDGDGQFVGDDLPRVLDALDDSSGRFVDAVRGVRIGRDEPWYRLAITSLVGAGVALTARRRIHDVNTPLRLYRPEALARLLRSCPRDALVPHVHFSLAERRLGLRVRAVPVRSIPRRGGTETGTMWGASPQRPKLPPRRLLSFSGRAATEVWRWDLSPLRRRTRAGAGEAAAVERASSGGATAGGSAAEGVATDAVADVGSGGAASDTGGAASGRGGAAADAGGATFDTGGAASGPGGAASDSGGATFDTGGAASGPGGATFDTGGAASGPGGAASGTDHAPDTPATHRVSSRDHPTGRP